MNNNCVNGTAALRMCPLLCKVFIVFIVLSLAICKASAACHVVTPAGSGGKTGADWNNAYAGLPSSLKRGDVYYLADGTYPAYTFTTALSGTLTLEIRKAQSYDNCTSTGWNAATMGAAQAIFAYTSSEPLIGINTSYVTINGNGSLAAPGCGGAPGASMTSEPPYPLDCGIRIDNSGCTSGSANTCSDPVKIEGAFNNYTLEYVEIVGNGNNVSDTEEVFAPYTGGGGPSTINHLFGRNAGCVFLQYDANHRTVSNSYFWGTKSNSSECHGQAEFYSPPDSNYTNFNNIYRDISGSAVWTIANPGTGTSNNFVWYNDVVYNSPTFVPGSGGQGTLDDGVLGCFNSGVVCTNFQFYNNSFINLGYATGTLSCDLTAGCTETWEDNIWFQTTGYQTTAPTPPAFNTTAGATFTVQYNSFLNSGSSCHAGTANVCAAASAIPFVNWTVGNFVTVLDNANWNNRMTLTGSTYNVDPRNFPRTTSRGAYQYYPPAAPANLAGTSTLQ